jgi:hypothetical protein
VGKDLEEKKGVQMDQHLQDLMQTVEVGEPAFRENLTVFPIFGPERSSPNYMTLDEAIQTGSAEITEVSEGGSVPELLFKNHGKRPVLVLDGEELTGAKQNRIVNLTLMVAAESTAVIPVSCVEAGRWRETTSQFASANRVHFSEARARKMGRVNASMAAVGVASSNQGEVWEDIDHKMSRMRTASSTRASESMYVGHEKGLEDLVDAFPITGGETGAGFAINGEIAGIEILDRHESFAKIFGKLVRSYGIDAIDHREETRGLNKETNCKTFISLVGQSRPNSYDSPFMGQDVRFSEEAHVGAGLFVEDHFVHICAFSQSDSTRSSGHGDRGMRGASARANAQRNRRTNGIG